MHYLWRIHCLRYREITLRRKKMNYIDHYKTYQHRCKVSQNSLSYYGIKTGTISLNTYTYKFTSNKNIRLER